MRTVGAGHELLPKGLQTESSSVESERVSIRAGVAATRHVCPDCGHGSSGVHSLYLRIVSDLPWHGVRVTFKIRSSPRRREAQARP